MILEGVVTTLDEEQRPNVSPMGPRVSSAMDELILRPYQSSRTYRNLERHGEGVFHVTDDAELIARAAVGVIDPAVERAKVIDGYRLADACRAYEFRVLDLDNREERTTIRAEVVHVERIRDFFGFHRARHAVVEAAILATRVHIIPRDQILSEFERLQVLVDKTGSEAEHRALIYLGDYVRASSITSESEASS